MTVDLWLNVWVLASAVAIAVLLDWFAIVRDDYVLERIAAPTVTLLLMGLAWSLQGDAPPPGAPAIASVWLPLGIGVVADVLLLNATVGRYLAALIVQSVAHVAWARVVLETPSAGFPWLLLVAAPAVLLAHERWGRDSVRHSGNQRAAVLLMLVTCVALVAVAAWRGDPLVLGGALLLHLSHVVRGHDRFALERQWAPLQSVALHQAGLALLVVGLLH